MVDHRIVVGIQEDLVSLIHVSWVISHSKYRLAPPQRLAILVLLRFVFSPYEELVRTLVSIWAPKLMGFEEGRLPMGKSICWIGMNCQS